MTVKETTPNDDEPHTADTGSTDDAVSNQDLTITSEETISDAAVPDIQVESEAAPLLTNDDEPAVPIEIEASDIDTELRDKENISNDDEPHTADIGSTEGAVSNQDLNITSEETIPDAAVSDIQVEPETAALPIDNDSIDIQIQEFPDTFYDPITMKIMEDPVVTPDGTSYERSAIIQQRGDDIESAGKLYPNRALLSIINETVELNGDSFMPVMTKLNKAIGTSMRQFLNISANPTKEFRPLPDVYYCPITISLMHDPVIDPEGNTFERAAVEKWINKNKSSPITRTPLSTNDLYCNRAITTLLEIEKGKRVENMHPSIRRFIQESPPVVTQEAPPEATIFHYPTTPLYGSEDRRRRIWIKRVKTAAKRVITVPVFLVGFLFGFLLAIATVFLSYKHVKIVSGFLLIIATAVLIAVFRLWPLFLPFGLFLIPVLSCSRFLSDNSNP